MLEYLSLKKIKQHQADKRAREKLAEDSLRSPVLSEEDEHFLEHIVSDEGPAPPLPDRPSFLEANSITEAGDSTNNNAQVALRDDSPSKAKHSEPNDGLKKENVSDKEKKKSKRFSFMRKSHKELDDGLKPNVSVPPKEADKEEDDISRVLEDLNLAAVNNRAFSLSKESQVLVQKFTLILKDLVNGVPTAYDDLVKLIDDSSGILSKNYENLPSYLKKLVATLPNKLTGNLAPELLAVATEAQGLGAAAATGGFSAAAKMAFTPSTLKTLVTKPGAVAGMLRTIINALKLRWPAFIGTNVLFSLGLFILLFVFWYCHKRGREVRLEKERRVESNGRVTELEDDAMLPPAGATNRDMPPHTSAAAATSQVVKPKPGETPILRP